MTEIKTDDKSLVERWEGTGLLAGVDDAKVKESLVACLEAQRIHNEETEEPSWWKRVSIPVIRRAIATSEALKRNTFVSCEESNEIQPEIFVFNTKYEFRGIPAPKNLTDDNALHHFNAAGLASEAEAVSEFSLKFKEEFDNLFKDQYKKKIYFKGLAGNSEGTVYLYYNLL